MDKKKTIIVLIVAALLLAVGLYGYNNIPILRSIVPFKLSTNINLGSNRFAPKKMLVKGYYAQFGGTAIILVTDRDNPTEDNLLNIEPTINATYWCIPQKIQLAGGSQLDLEQNTPKLENITTEFGVVVNEESSTDLASVIPKLVTDYTIIMAYGNESQKEGITVEAEKIWVVGCNE